jgi:hypothetical protein
LYEYLGSNPLANMDAIGLFGGSGYTLPGPPAPPIPVTPVPPSPGPGLGGIYVPNMGDISIWFGRNGETETVLDSSTKIAFFPSKCGKKCCDKIVFVQIAYSYSYTFMWPLDPISIKPWHVDKGVPFPQSRPWPGGWSRELRVSCAQLCDDPYWAGWLKPKVFFQQFNSCAICVEGQDRGANYGCVHWWHKFVAPSGGAGDYTVTRHAFETTRMGYGDNQPKIKITHHGPEAPQSMFEIVPPVPLFTE